MFRCRQSLVPIRRASTTLQLESGSLPCDAYQPKLVEQSRYKHWEERGLFRADSEKHGDVFSVVLPPPNVTGKLHLGHALASTVQDVIVRRQRSLGKAALWLPGTDHAGIATQGVVEKYLKSKHNTDRHQLGRDKFNREVWKWKEQYGDAICDQLRTLGASLDWSRLVFTMDPSQTFAVNSAFVRLYDKGLIYRKTALVNWCIELKSTLSDIEVDNVSVETPTDWKLPGYDRPVKFGHMTEFAYKVCDGCEEIVVSTTRLETMLGDVAVAVHPHDERYIHLHGARVHHPFRGDTLPIIVDEFVDMKLGTGAVKITPAHSKTDYEVSQRHNLQMLQIIDEDGLMNENAGRFRYLKRYDCRDALVEKLKDLGVLRNVKPHAMVLPMCSRTSDVIEVLPKEQWFLSCKEMNKKAANAVRNGQLKIVPEKFEKNWLMWTEDDRDWCISRQLWWGHRIPAYKCNDGKRQVWVAALDDNEARNKAAKELKIHEKDVILERDQDVLDTWFSSGIYPFSSLGWPKNTKDYQKFYPLSLMVTGHDILGFWVHRMVILALEMTGKLPFNDVLLHGIICDSKGAKMSKSRGNVIDPIDVINGISLQQLNEKSEEMFKTGVLTATELQRTKAYNKSNFSKGIPECGVDALRFTLLSRDIKSHYIHFDVDLCNTNMLFCNKIWQSIKYMQMSFAKLKDVDAVTQNDLSKLDRWILSRLDHMVNKVNRSMDNYDFNIATNAIKSLLYSEFCDIYLETTKPGFDGDNLKQAYAHSHTLSAVLNVSLRCLSPFMIYLAQELIPRIPGFEENLIHNFRDLKNEYFDYPQCNDFASWRDKDLERDIGVFNDTISLVRQLRGFYTIPNRIKPQVYIKNNDSKISSTIIENGVIFKTLTRCSEVNFTNVELAISKGSHFVSGVLNKDCTVSLRLEESSEIQKLIETAQCRLRKKIQKVQENICKLEEKISSSKYKDRAPELVQIADKERIKNLHFELSQLNRLTRSVEL